MAHLGDANFVLAWGGLPGKGKLIFYTGPSEGNGPDLLNAGGPFAGLKAEDFAAFSISFEWDSWVTVGTTVWVGNQTNYTQGFIGSNGVDAVVVGNAFSSSEQEEGLVFDSDPTSPILGPDVVLAQFTIPVGVGFHLEGVVVWFPPPSAAPGFFVDSFVVDNIPEPCPWDLDGSGAIGVKDLLFLLGAWGLCPKQGDCPADFDDSGDVGVKDLLTLLGNWGPCP